MCGIAGIISLQPEPRITRMLESIEHRGRDDQGVWTSEPIDTDNRQVCLGHRRLAIIDPSPAGHEPMFSHDGRYVLVFNGEIYNYRELREQLRPHGHQFRTESDAEALLASIVEWGWDAMDRLNGMFAFAVWDNKEKTLTLARDHAGIKPLYYAFIPGDNNAPPAFVFGSEIKAILASTLIKPALDPEALHQFLTFLWSPDPNTLFAGVKTVPPAHLLHFKNDEIKLRQWWDVSFTHIEEGHNEAWWRERTLATLDRVVKMEMVADVPLGSFLSGGIDSSGITAMMQRHVNDQRISTYTVGIESHDLRYDIIPDDVRWARRVNEQLQTDYNEIMLQPSVADLLPKLVYHMEEPPIDMAIPSYLISQAARETLRVMLSGMGGDEVFAGYPRQMAMKLAAAFDPVPQLLRRPLMKSVAAVLPGGLPGKLTAPLRNIKKFANSAALDFEERYLGYGTYFTDKMKHQLYSDEWRALTRNYDPYAKHREYFARAAGADPLNRLLYVDLKTFLPCLNLMTTDKTSMAANLEVRVPFLNREMIEMAARMPPRLKLHGLKRKYVLKRALEDVLSKEVVWRRKAGFGAPIRSWLRGPLQPLISDLLSESAVKRRGLFRPKEVKRVMDANFSGREDYNLQVFQLLGLELWHQTFLDS
ncbi:MAG TPA: asparagine synthase (glutamine-hydrolyzing) [Pyrinomonadaceae bacterium]|nr:asparagine synthase (glutamine-hydrolyzing) [Pyrinomonadaceae bacterium]